MGLFDLFKKKKEQGNTKEDSLNKIWDLWEKGKAKAPYAQIMTYQAEVNNGGHDQFFFNLSNIGELEETMDILKNALPEPMKEAFDKAYAAFLVLDKDEDNEEAQQILEECDDAFYENEQLIQDILKEYAERI